MRRTIAREAQRTTQGHAEWSSSSSLPYSLVSLRGMAKPAVSVAALERAIQQVRRSLKAN
ncbi:MAG: hypothetical protein HYZ89_08515 [Candidatus Omnitrophica bacterium]|nr:hypothetical protein [Candidatus Omnitrophota bacterium]